MGARHWSDEELLAGLYGVGPTDGHPNDCADCRQRWELMCRRQEDLRLTEPNLSGAFLASQRRAITARTEGRPRSSRFQVVPWLAAVVLLLLAILINRPAPKLRPAPEVSDAQFFEDVFSTVSRSEPRALEPVRSLFLVNQ
jgi:hypothetical protein